MKLGDLIKILASPFARFMNMENCQKCEQRRIYLNRFSDLVWSFITKITCPCWWKGLFSK